MPIIPGVQICTTDMKAPKAGAIIAKMENLLDKRRTKQITRQGFLIAWGKLRNGMRMTHDYQQLIIRVSARAGGVCQTCKDRVGAHVHHIKPVAFEPRLILLDANCIWVCAECHPEEDRKSQLRARRAARSGCGRPTDELRTQPGTPSRRAEGALKLTVVPMSSNRELRITSND